MELCKSCSNTIQAIDKYCNQCGGKVVDKRLSFRGTWEEFIGPFFSWDNNFWKTLYHLMVSPEKVMNAYVSGARKKYFQPFSFLIVYATIALFFYKLFPIDVFSEFSKEMAEAIAASQPQNVETTGAQFDMMNVMFSNYNIVIVLMLPFTALITFLSLKPHKHNFFEHLVFQAYVQTFLGYSSLLLQVVLVDMLGFGFMNYSLVYFIMAIAYSNYVYQNLYKYSFKHMIWVNIKFGLSSLFLSIAIMILGVLFTAASQFIQ